MMNENRDNRLLCVVWMQMIGCFLVILGHSYPFVTVVPEWAKGLKLFIYSFHMPLFVWCSGYLMAITNQSDKYGFLKYAARRAKRILVPYFVFSLVGLVPKVLFSSLLNDNLSFDFGGIVQAFFVPRDNIWGHFWFLPMIYFLGLIGYGITKLQKSVRFVDIIFLIVAIGAFFAPKLTGWFSVNDIVHYAVYFILGIVCGLRIKELTVHYTFSIPLILISVALFAVWGSRNYIKLIVAVLMTVAVWLLCEKIGRRYQPNRQAIYTQTYTIFIFSWPCQLVVEILLERVLGMPFFVVFPSMLLVGILGPVLLIYIINAFEKKTKTKLISTLIGR